MTGYLRDTNILSDEYAALVVVSDNTRDFSGVEAVDPMRPSLRARAAPSGFPRQTPLGPPPRFR